MVIKIAKCLKEAKAQSLAINRLGSDDSHFDA